MAKQFRNTGGRTVWVGGLLFTLLSPVCVQAQTSGGNASVSDAQVEANVLKALAAAPELSAQNIQSSTVYGTVTLSGTVQDEAKRSRAENLAARAPGVQKVVDELTIGTPSSADTNSREPEATDNSQQPVLQSDGSYAPPQPSQPATPYDGSRNAPPGYVNGDEAYGQQGSQPPAQDQPQAGQGTYSNSYPNQGGASPQAGSPSYGQQPYAGQQPYTGQQPAYGQQNPYGQQPGYSQSPGYPSSPYGQATNPPPNGYGQPSPYPQGAYPQPPQGYPGPQGGQQAGVPVAVPSGALLRVRIGRGLDSNHTAIGTPFDGTVLSDVAADGQIAIPRGATVQGVVVDAKRAGALKGEGELALQLNSVNLGGVNYPLTSDVWQQFGRDKSARTVNSALGLGALGAIIGGVAGGGAGAAIGAGVGAGAGVAGSASSPSGAIVVPPEAVLNFHVQQPAEVRTVSEGEMQRLAYAAGPVPGARPVVQRRYPYGYPPPPPPPPPGYYRY